MEGEVIPLIIPTEFSKASQTYAKIGLVVLKDKWNELLLNIRQVGYALYHSEENQKHQSPFGPLVYLHPER